MSGLTPAQLADAITRQRDGRPDKAAMTAEERRALGLMDRRQAAEHERLAVVPWTRLADRTRVPDPDDPWTAAPARGEPDADEYCAVWVLVFLGGHGDHGGWWRDQGRPVCACGEVIALPPAEATA